MNHLTIRPVTSGSDVSELRDRKTWEDVPLIAIDLGFSGKAATTGFCCCCCEGSSHTEPLTFGDAVDRVKAAVSLHREIILILEAPLSGKFSKGSPEPRGWFEKEGRYRAWNVAAGAAVSLAALHFLAALHRAALSGTIHLIEGFVSSHNKPSIPGAEKMSSAERKAAQHEADARHLWSAFTSSPDDAWVHTENAEDDWIAASNVVRLTVDAKPPSILIPKIPQPA